MVVSIKEISYLKPMNNILYQFFAHQHLVNSIAQDVNANKSLRIMHEAAHETQ
jgi:hypothetical protein